MACPHCKSNDSFLGTIDVFAHWCHAQGLVFRVSNENHHWRISEGSSSNADWYPSSGKLVFNKDYSRVLHVTSIEELKRELLREFNRRI